MSTTAAELSVSTAAATAWTTKFHLFNIEGYRRIKIMYGNGKGLESCAFEAAGRTWKIRFFPDGDKETAGYISLFLKLEDDDATAEAGNDILRAEVRLDLVRHCRATASPLHGISFTTTFSKDRKAAGHPHFIKRQDLEKSEFLKDDCLAVRCDVSVLKQPVEAEERAALASDMERLDMVCDCKNDARKGRRLRGGLWLREAFAKFFLGCFQV